MRRYALGAHTKPDLKEHVVWIAKYRKRVLTGQVAIRTRDVLRHIALEHELEIITGKVASDDDSTVHHPCLPWYRLVVRPLSSTATAQAVQS